LTNFVAPAVWHDFVPDQSDNGHDLYDGHLADGLQYS
jgi:hypothetical protein